MEPHSARGGWRDLILSGLVAGAVINIIEWLVHRVWLYDKWVAAIATFGKSPSNWTPFVIANFGVGILSIWPYRCLSGF
jgi:hypothetical protein